MKVYGLALAAAVAVLAALEWRTDEDLVTLMVLAATSFAMGALRPRLFWLSALVLGGVVPALNVFTTLTGLRPIYETAAQAAAHGVAYGLSLGVLVIPALVAAALGAMLRRWSGNLASSPSDT